jgi:hypothetical protein
MKDFQRKVAKVAENRKGIGPNRVGSLINFCEPNARRNKLRLHETLRTLRLGVEIARHEC